MLRPVDEPELENVLYPHFPHEAGRLDMLKQASLLEEGIHIPDVFLRRQPFTQPVGSPLA